MTSCIGYMDNVRENSIKTGKVKLVLVTQLSLITINPSCRRVLDVSKMTAFGEQNAESYLFFVTQSCASRPFPRFK